MKIDPWPRETALSYEPFDWSEFEKESLEPFHGPLSCDLARLLEVRESSRDFSNPVPKKVLGEFLWLACRNRSVRICSSGHVQESRVHPSAGGMHPIHTLVSCEKGAWQRYDPIHHELQLVCGSANAVEMTSTKAREVLALDNGSLFVIVAEHGKTASKYEHAESLIWRDAGVVLGYMSIVAHALGLAFCPLGITGHPYALSGWSTHQRLISAGLAVLGVPRAK